MVRPAVLARLRRACPEWRSALVVSRPATVIGWHRRGFAWSWTRKSRRRTRDATFDVAFYGSLQTSGLASVRTAARSPWQNPSVERAIGSIRRECLDHVLVVNERHLRWVLPYLASCHRSRTHLALGKDTPDARPVQATGSSRIVTLPEVGGLHHRYERRAA